MWKNAMWQKRVLKQTCGERMYINFYNGETYMKLSSHIC